MKSKNRLILSINLLFSSTVFAAHSLEIQEAQIVERMEFAHTAFEDAQSALSANATAKALVDALNSAQEGNANAISEFAKFKLDNRTYVQAALAFAKKNRQLAAIITASVLVGFLLDKMFFSDDLSPLGDDDFDMENN